MNGSAGGVGLRLAVAAWAVAAAGAARGGEAAGWPQWRGPGRDGVSTETGWRTDWPAGGPKRLWRREVGMGFAAVAVAGGRAYTSGNRRQEDIVWCLDAATGRAVWSYAYPMPSRQGGAWPGTQATPTVHAGRLYHYSRDARLYCLDANDGRLTWWKDLLVHYRAGEVMHDYASSPLLTDGVVIVTAKLPGATIVAFDAATGKEAWRADHAASEVGGIWSSPVVGDVDGRRCVVRLTGTSVVGVRPTDGQTLWTYAFRAAAGLEPHRLSGVAATCVLAGSKVVFMHHVKDGVTLSGCIEVRGGAAKLLWTSRRLADQWHGCTLWRGRLFGNSRWGGAGVLYCVDPADGKVAWSARRFGDVRAGGVFTIADGKLIQWRRGQVAVVDLSQDGGKLLAAAQVASERGLCGFTVPVLAGGRLYLRATTLPRRGQAGRSTLTCLDLRGNVK